MTKKRSGWFEIARHSKDDDFRSLLMSVLGRKRTLAKSGNERPLTDTGLNPGNDRDGRKAAVRLMSAMGRKRTLAECAPLMDVHEHDSFHSGRH